jgi:hypothetical protein
VGYGSPFFVGDKLEENDRRLTMVPENASPINIQLVDSLIQAIQSLSPAEQFLLDQKLYANLPEPSTQELMQLADRGGAFAFLHDEPDLYTVEDGEPIQWA